MSYEVGSRKPIPGDKVQIVQKKDYESGKLTAGIVKDVLTSKLFHPRGHKVRLTNGTIGRVQAFEDTVADASAEQPKSNYSPDPDDLL